MKALVSGSSAQTQADHAKIVICRIKGVAHAKIQLGIPPLLTQGLMPWTIILLQGSKNLFSNTRQGGSKRKGLVAKVAV